MSVNTLDDLLLESLKDIYYAEKKILVALPQMAKKAATEQLTEALENHREETIGQVERLEQVFKLMGEKAKGKKCPAIEGMIEEGKEHMSEIEDEIVRDAGIIGAAQSVEHYEIARYGTMIAWARRLGHNQIASLLEKNLKEEKAADELLTEIAEAMVNSEAAAAAE